MDIKISKHTVSVKQIQDPLHKLQSAKSDCKDQLLSDHFINGNVKMFYVNFFVVYMYVNTWCCTKR